MAKASDASNSDCFVTSSELCSRLGHFYLST